MTAEERFKSIVRRFLNRGEAPVPTRLNQALGHQRMWMNRLSGRESRWRRELLEEYGWTFDEKRQRWTQPTYRGITDWGEGYRVVVHPPSQCASVFCPFHFPSEHALADAPILIRIDKRYLVERVCEHGCGHDDPDSVAYLREQGENWAGVHGCDGCCMGVDV